MSNNFDNPVIVDEAPGTPAAPSDYIGFGRAAGASVSTGQRIYAGSGTPNGVLTAPAGSIYLTSDGGGGGTGTVFVNTDGAVAWSNLL